MPPRKPVTHHNLRTAPDVDPDHRDRLISLRDVLTERIADAPVAYVAGLARQLQAVLDELSSMPEPRPESTVERIAARRRTNPARALTIAEPERTEQ